MTQELTKWRVMGVHGPLWVLWISFHIVKRCKIIQYNTYLSLNEILLICWLHMLLFSQNVWPINRFGDSLFQLASKQVWFYEQNSLFLQFKQCLTLINAGNKESIFSSAFRFIPDIMDSTPTSLLPSKFEDLAGIKFPLIPSSALNACGLAQRIFDKD